MPQYHHLRQLRLSRPQKLKSRTEANEAASVVARDHNLSVIHVVVLRVLVHVIEHLSKFFLAARGFGLRRELVIHVERDAVKFVGPPYHQLIILTRRLGKTAASMRPNQRRTLLIPQLGGVHYYVDRRVTLIGLDLDFGGDDLVDPWFVCFFYLRHHSLNLLILLRPLLLNIVTIDPQQIRVGLDIRT